MPRETVAEFAVEEVQVLSEDETVDEDIIPDLSDDELFELYESMKRSRRLDERAISLQRRGELGTYALAIGQEAAQVGSAYALADDDWVVPSFREGPALLVHGTPPSRCSSTHSGWRRARRSPAEPARCRRPSPSAVSRCTPSASAGGRRCRGGTTSPSRTSATAPRARATSTRR